MGEPRMPANADQTRSGTEELPQPEDLTIVDGYTKEKVSHQRLIQRIVHKTMNKDLDAMLKKAGLPPSDPNGNDNKLPGEGNLDYSSFLGTKGELKEKEKKTDPEGDIGGEDANDPGAAEDLHVH